MSKSWDVIPGYFGEDQRSFYDSVVKWLKGRIEICILACQYKVVEVGSCMGRSICYLGQQLIANQITPDQVTLYCVDHFKGSLQESAWRFRGLDIEKEFDKNIKECGVSEFITKLALDSVEAATRFEDYSCAVVFIDASHEYEAVKADINAWWPKVMIGGIFAGDDYAETRGVKPAVDERFPGARIQGRVWIFNN